MAAPVMGFGGWRAEVVAPHARGFCLWMRDDEDIVPYAKATVPRSVVGADVPIGPFTGTIIRPTIV